MDSSAQSPSFRCKGIEYNLDFDGGRCELWDISYTDIGAYFERPLTSVASPGFTCLEYNAHGLVLAPLDGGNDRACRGSHDNDNSPEHYELHDSIASIYACESLCAHDSACVGIEYNSRWRRCELWKGGCFYTGIGATQAREGFTCLGLSRHYLEARMGVGCPVNTSAGGNMTSSSVALSENSSDAVGSNTSRRVPRTSVVQAGTIANYTSSSITKEIASSPGQQRRLLAEALVV